MESPSTTNIAIDIQVYRALEALRLSFAEDHNAILRRQLGLDKTAIQTQPAPQTIRAQKRQYEKSPKRQTGTYAFYLNSKKFEERSLRDAYTKILNELENSQPGFLEKLSREETRARRIVALEPRDLYIRSPQLADTFAEKLNQQYWVDLNLSQDQVVSRIEVAARLMGYSLGKEIRLEFPS